MSLGQAASVSIHGPHGQHIENIHLEQFDSEEDFWTNLYPRKYIKLLERAEDFLKQTDAEDVLVFIRYAAFAFLVGELATNLNFLSN